MNTTPVNDRYQDEMGRMVSLLAIDQYFRAIGWLTRLSEDEERRMLERVARGNQERQKATPDHWRLHLAQDARARLVEHYQKAVIYTARRVARQFQSMDLLDVIQEGNIGLLQALDAWGVCPCEAFSALAFTCMRRAMWLAYYGSDCPLHLSQHVRDALSKLRRYERRWWSEWGREPSVTELAHMMGRPEEEMVELLAWRMQMKVTSVQALTEAHETPEEYYTFSSLYARSCVGSSSVPPHVREALANALSSLTDFQRRVFALRFGLDEHDAGGMTRQAVADLLGTSEQVVFKVERKACHVLRRFLEPVLSGQAADEAAAGVSCESYYTAVQVATLLGVTAATVCNRAKAGTLPTVLYQGVYQGMHHEYLFPVKAIDCLLKARGDAVALAPDVYYTSAQVAALLGVTSTTIYNRVKERVLPALEHAEVYQGKRHRYLFPKEHIDRLVSVRAAQLA